MPINAPKGTQDILPAQIKRWHRLEAIIRELCRVFGYKEIRTPLFEHTELFSRGVGETTDVVQKEMYTFDDKAGRSLTLRPEGTAGVVRAFIENGMASQAMPHKLYYYGPMYRYENVQRGRYREFWQFGCEVLGAAGPGADTELISLLVMLFKRLGLDRTDLRINSIGCPVCRPPYYAALKDYIAVRLDRLCGDCRGRFERNPLRVLDCKQESCKTLMAGAPMALDHLCPDCANHFEELKHNLTGLGIEYTVDKTIVRGLDYYTRTVFEFLSDSFTSLGSTICGGGRYDGLVGVCGGPETPGVGFSVGVERLLMEIDARRAAAAAAAATAAVAATDVTDAAAVSATDAAAAAATVAATDAAAAADTAAAADAVRPDGPDLFIVCADKQASEYAARLVNKLRDAGRSAEIDLNGRSVKAQMKYANKINAAYTTVIGAEEFSSGKASLRNMADGSVSEINLDELWQAGFDHAPPQ